MYDAFGRNINYLRVSITDRCNLRCQYCMPQDGVNSIGHKGILSLEDIARLIKIGANNGIRKVRLTGGEPLIRKNINQLIHYIREIKAIDDIAITTNGILFSGMADEMKAAGLNRVNFSLDSLQAEKFRYITRTGDLHVVIKSVEKAMELGLHPIKINTVIIKGFNNDEILDFADWAFKFPLHIRFIEFMPVGDLLFWSREKMMSSQEIMKQIEQKYTLQEGTRIQGNGPARYYTIPGGSGSIGFISPMSNHFCSACNRVRLTAEGKLRACLHNQEETDFRSALQRGASDEELAELFRQTINAKPGKHNMDAGWGEENSRKMYQIGG